MKVFQDIPYLNLVFKTDPWLKPKEHEAVAWDNYIGC